MWYRSAGAAAFCAYYLHSTQEVADAERDMREAFNNGQVDQEVSYLTRWNRETNEVEFVIGKLYEWEKTDTGESEAGAERRSSPNVALRVAHSA
jgi:hypothetical protein